MRNPGQSLKRAARQAVIEILEKRQLLTTVIVNSPLDNVTDSNIGGSSVTLREAVNYENANGGGTISFDSSLAGKTITLTSGQLEIGNGANVTITAGGVAGITISGNNASRVFQIDSTAEIDNLTLSNGNSSGSGGAISNGGTLTLNADTITASTNGGAGGGIFSNGTLNVTNSTIYGNTGGGQGGGGFAIYGGNATLTNDTITGNSDHGGGGAQGGGVGAFYGSVTLVNTIVAGNKADSSGPDVSGSVTSLGHNLIGDTSGSGGWISTDLTGTNPLLASLGNYGGPTQTMPPLPGSPAIGAGTPVNGITTDQRGVTRSAAAPSIGAFESAGFNVTVASGDNQSTTPGFSFAPLVVAVTPIEAGDPVSGGVVVQFTVNPVAGAGATLANASATINANGTASTAVTADAVAGSYTVTAASAGATGIATFHLTNTPGSLVVNTNSDSATPVPGMNTLRQAFAYADVLSTPSTITFAPGLAGQTITLNQGELLSHTVNNSNITIDASGVGGVTLDGGGTSRIFQVAADTTLSLNDLTIADGSGGQGGGIYDYGVLNVTDCIFSNDHANQGGAIFSVAYGGGPEVAIAVTESTLSGDTAEIGGAIYTYSDGGYSSLTLKNSTLSSDQAYIGGAIASVEGDGTNSVTLVGCALFGDTAGGNGGAIASVTNFYGNNSVTLVGCALSDDTADNNGGAIASTGNEYGNAALTLMDSTLSDDTADNNGGAIASAGNYGGNAALTLMDSTLSGNTAGNDGGAIASTGYVYGNAALTSMDSTLSGDTADSRGGGIYSHSYRSATAAATVTDGTFSGNSALSGGDFYNGSYNNAESYLTLTNSILANSPQGGDYYSAGGTISGNNNLVDDGSDGLPDTIKANPLLGTLGNYGGPTQTIPLLPGSPAIGAGVPIAGVTTDQTGYTRSATAPSIGAYENEGFTITATGGTPQATLNGTAFGSPLAVKVSSNNAALTNLSGGVITFTAPSTGATATLSSATATITSSNTASVTATANSTPGNYNVSAGGVGIATPAVFSLSNDETPSLVVTTSSDNSTPTDGLTSLREAIAYADSLGGGTITFASNLAGQTITLGGSQLELTATANAVTIDASSIGGITISGNTASRIFQVDYGATVYLTDLTITNGSASIGGGIITSGMLTVTDSTFTNDSSTQELGGGGAGIYNCNGGEVTITNSTFTNDSDNTEAFGGGGGGIYNGHDMTVTNCTFTNDSTGRYGGAICNVGDLTVTNSTFNNDSAYFGGGIYNSDALTITSSTFSNDSSDSGGGIYNDGGLTINNSTFNDSSARVGGGIFNSGSLTITSSTFYGNSGYGSDLYSPTTPTAYNSIFTGGISGGLTGSNNLLSTAGLPASVGTVEPTLAAFGLGTLGNYGGPTQTIPLLPGSPAIGAGVAIAGVTTDQTGYTRSATAPSIGAYENEGFTITATGGGQTTAPLTAFAKPLGVKVSSNNAMLTNLSGGVITFSAPATGASATFGTNPIILAADGTGSTLATASGTPGNYSVTAGGSGITNPATFTLTNAKLTPTITVTDNTAVYDGSPFTATSTVNGTPNAAVVYSYFYASDTSFQHQLPSAPTSVGNYLVIAVYNGNSTYNAVGVAAYFNITPAKSRVTITANGGTYTGLAIGATATVTGLNNIAASSLESVVPTLLYYTGLTATGTGSSTAPMNAGTYTVVATFPGSADYSTASASKTFSITQAASNVTVTGKSGTYNGLPYGAIGSVSGVALSTTPTFTYTGINGTSYSSTTAPTNAGSYSVTATYLGDTNHTGNTATATFTIAQATPSISVTDTGGVYNTLPYAATGTTTGVNGTSLGSPTYRYYLSSDTSFSNPTTTAPTNVGSYVLIALSPVNSNYMQVGVAIYFSITQASSVLTPAATTVAYGGSTTLSTTLKTTGGALLAGRTVTFSVNGKVIGTAVTNSSGVASVGDSVAGITPGVYASGIAVSFAGDGNSTATSATTSLTVLDAPIVSSVGVTNLLNVASVSGSFTQARAGAAASDFVATVNWGDGNTQTLLVVADLLHPGQFDLVGLSHIYLQLNQKFTVTVTISTVGKFGAVAGNTASYVTTIIA